MIGQGRLGSGASVVTLPINNLNHIASTRRRCFFDRRSGRICTNFVGLIFMGVGGLMAYFGFYAIRHDEVLKGDNETLIVDASTSSTINLMENVNYGLYSLQFIGPMLASLGAFMIMVSLVGHFVHREEKVESLRGYSKVIAKRILRQH